MKWSDRYATGVKALDEQHKMLFQMSEDFRATLNEGRGERGYGLLLESLDEYARAHFMLEEQCMHRYRCPAAQMNREAHATFVEAMSGFRKRYAVNGFNPADALQLVQYVDDWLANHIGRIDVQLKPCVETSQP